MPAAKSLGSIFTRAGLSSWRRFHQPVSDPCGSVSRIAVDPPICCIATARLRSRVVLPAPPFWLATTMMFMHASLRTDVRIDVLGSASAETGTLGANGKQVVKLTGQPFMAAAGFLRLAWYGLCRSRLTA